jgi:hypothetical protein
MADLLRVDLDGIDGAEVETIILGLMERFGIPPEHIVASDVGTDLRPWTHRKMVAGKGQAFISLPPTVNDPRVAIMVGGVNLVDATHVRKRIVIESDAESGQVVAKIELAFPEVQATVDKVELPREALATLAKMNGFALVPLCESCGAEPAGVDKLSTVCAACELKAMAAAGAFEEDIGRRGSP